MDENMKKSKGIKYTQCNHGMYRKIIELLGKITGTVWGFVRDGHKITYVSSDVIQYKFAIKGSTRRRVDYEVVNCDTKVENHESILAHELKTAILHLLQTRPQVAPKSYVDKIYGDMGAFSTVNTYIMNATADSIISHVRKFVTNQINDQINNDIMSTCTEYCKYDKTCIGEHIPGMFARELELAAEELTKNGEFMPKIFTIDELM